MDIVLTGIVRSGTTLSCWLLNKLPTCVALHEPIDPNSLLGLDFPAEYLDEVKKFFITQRASLISSRIAVTKASKGAIPDNPFDGKAANGRLRASTVQVQNVYFDKPLEEGFRLVIKQPNFFTATLGALTTRFPCFAIVRNPLATLLSWQTVEARFNDGRVPAAEAFDETLKQELESEPSRLERQLIILRWYFARYASLLPADRVIKYEDIVATGGRILAIIDPAAASLQVKLENRNRNPIYDRDQVGELARLLLRDETIYKAFYTGREVEELFSALSRGD
jgi:hypothetical protein